MTNIFISYRRSDSITITGRIYDRLATAFGTANVFKDVDDLPPGVDFRTVLDEHLSRADILLVIIGPTWIKATADNGVRYIDDSNDFVRQEVESGLQRKDILVVPVLVNGAQMPTVSELPVAIEELRFRNSVVVRNDPDFNDDIKKLVHVLDTRPKRPTWLIPVAALAVIALLAIIILGSGILNAPAATPTATPQPIAAVTNEASATSEPENTATEVLSTETATIAATDTPTVAPSLTPTPGLPPQAPYPDGYRLQLFYDETSFYVHNPGGTRLRVAPLSFETMSEEGDPLPNTFEGVDWSRFYEFLDSGACDAIEILQATRHLDPEECGGTFHSTRTPPNTDETVFWTVRDGAKWFRVLWDGEDVGWCEIGAASCEVRIPV